MPKEPLNPASPSDPDLLNDAEAEDPQGESYEDIGDTDIEPQGSQDIGPMLRQATDALRELFDTLVPLKTIMLEDVFGMSYTVRGSLNARSQIKVAQALEAMFGSSADEATRATLLRAREQGMDGIIAAMIELATDPAVMASLASAFEAAHPDVVAHALETSQKHDEECIDAADVFAVEEMVAGLLPFFVRFGVRALNIADTMLPTTVSKAA